jgi:hypothetical protein
MPTKETAAPDQDCPDIRIQVIDIVQPPGMRMPPMADMDTQQTIVTATLMVKRSADTIKNG